jgi:hypothetical protein
MHGSKSSICSFRIYNQSLCHVGHLCSLFHNHGQIPQCLVKLCLQRSGCVLFFFPPSFLDDCADSQPSVNSLDNRPCHVVPSIWNFFTKSLPGVHQRQFQLLRDAAVAGQRPVIWYSVQGNWMFDKRFASQHCHGRRGTNAFKCTWC